MKNIDTKSKLIETTKRLLLNGIAAESLTARQISVEAGTNLAMINYCFKSKNELVKIAVGEIVAEEFAQYAKSETSELTAKEQLMELLLHVCGVMMKYRDLTKASIPYLLLEDEISLPLDILPFIKNHFGTGKSESECRIIAYQIVVTLQLIFYRAEEFRKYSGVDITKEQDIAKLLDMQLNLFLD